MWDSNPHENIFPINPKSTASTIPSLSYNCNPDRIRTCDRLLRRQMLYPTELRDYFNFGKYTIENYNLAFKSIIFLQSIYSSNSSNLMRPLSNIIGISSLEISTV